MAQPKPLHPFPLTIGKYRAEFVDPQGFEVMSVPGALARPQNGLVTSRDVSAEEEAATVLHTFVAYNSHQVLVYALKAALAYIENCSGRGREHAESVCKAALDALDAVDVLTETARAELYEESGEVRE